MEGNGEERIQVGNCLKQLEYFVTVLETAVNESSIHMVSTDMPNLVISLLHKMSTLSSRTDGERLLTAGVTIWNSVIVLDNLNSEKCSTHANPLFEVFVKLFMQQ
eukprot:IDg20799t1